MGSVCHRGRGFSLLETVCALSLLGLIVIFVVNIFPSSVLAARSGNERIAAEEIARSVLEETRAEAFNNLSVGTTNPPSSDPQFTVTREIYVPPNADAHQTLGVKVTVEWTHHEQTRQVEREVWISHVRF